jgi:hypothetical protein
VTIQCPFPSVSKTTTWVRESCETDLDLLIYGASLLVGALVVLLIALGTIYLAPSCAATKAVLARVLDHRDESTLTPAKAVAAAFLWILSCLDILSDIFFTLSMYEFISSLPLSDVQCRSCDTFFQPALVPGIAINNFRDYDFAFYLAYLKNYINAVAIENGLITRDSYATLRADTIDTFQAQCEAMTGCMFVRAENGCRADPDYNPFLLFRVLVGVSFGVVVCKELAKVMCVVYVAATAELGHHRAVLRACATSCALPLLGLRQGALRAVAAFEPSNTHILWEFLFESVCESTPQLVVYYIYTAHVTAVGLTSWQMLSIFFSVCFFLKSCLQAAHAAFDLYHGRDVISPAPKKIIRPKSLQVSRLPTFLTMQRFYSSDLKLTVKDSGKNNSTLPTLPVEISMAVEEHVICTHIEPETELAKARHAGSA